MFNKWNLLQKSSLVNELKEKNLDHEEDLLILT